MPENRDHINEKPLVKGIVSPYANVEENPEIRHGHPHFLASPPRPSLTSVP